MRRAPIAVPLTALLASTVSAIALAAQSGLAFCDNRVAMPSMPGMDMSTMPGMTGGQGVMICPVVLVLILSSALLAAGAIAVLWRDPHRALARREIVRALASLPPLRSAGAVMLLGGGALATMRAVDGTGGAGPAACATLALLLAGCSLAAVLFSIVAGNVLLAFGRRLVLAIAAAIASAGDAPPRVQRLVPAVAGPRAGALLAAGRGLRAPPSTVR
jgi:hypothetical protein